MLDAYIIEDLKRQEEARRRAEEEARRPRVTIEDIDPPGIDDPDRDAPAPVEQVVLQL